MTLIFSSEVTITSCRFYANQATKESSNIYSIFSTLTVTSSTFDDTDRINSSTEQITGGFMYLSTGSVVSITSSTFTKGFAVYGGAIYILGSADVILQSSTFRGNVADQGAAIHATSYNSFTISNN